MVMWQMLVSHRKIYLLTMTTLSAVFPTAKGNGNETPFNLFDGSKESKLFEFSNQFSIAWKMKQDTTLYSYSLTTANDNEAYMQKSKIMDIIWIIRWN